MQCHIPQLRFSKKVIALPFSTNVSSLDRFVHGTVDTDVISDVRAELKKAEEKIWHNEGKVTRRTINYGWSFPDLEEGRKVWIPIPSALRRLQHAVIESLHPYSATENPESYDAIIVTLYGPGQEIVPHWDRDETDVESKKTLFSFGPIIFGAVLEADTIEKKNSDSTDLNPASLCFWNYDNIVNEHAPKSKSSPSGYSMDPEMRSLISRSTPEFIVPEEAGTSFLFSGPLRYAPYLHGVPPVHTNRISVTLRSIDFSKEMS